MGFSFGKPTHGCLSFYSGPAALLAMRADPASVKHVSRVVRRMIRGVGGGLLCDDAKKILPCPLPIAL